MADPPPDPVPFEPKAFPVVTAVATLGTLFVFLGLILLAYNSPNYLGEPKLEPKADPAARLADVKARNQALLDGKGAKMSVDAATSELVGKLRSENDRLPFPVPEAVPAPPAVLKKP